MTFTIIGLTEETAFIPCWRCEKYKPEDEYSGMTCTECHLYLEANK